MKPSCLWLDDDRALLPGVSGFLHDQFSVEECSAYKEGLEKWQKQPSDLVILDAIIPFGGGLPSPGSYLGLEFAEELLRNGTPKPKCLAIFTVVEDEDVIKDIENLRASGLKVNVHVEYFNKISVMVTGVEAWVTRLLQLAVPS